MKKLLTTLLATTMVVGSLAGCSSSSKTTTETPSTTETTTEAPAEGGGKAINLTFAAQEVGTGAYTMATALQGAMLKGLPSGSSIDLLTTSPGGVGAPILIQTEECDLIVSNAGPSLWSYEMTTDEYQFAGGTDVRALGGGMGHAMMNVMFTQSFVDKTGYTTLEEVIENKYPIRFITKTNGSLGQLTAERAIEACGITIEEFLEFATWEKTGTDAIKSGLQDDIYDATIDHVDAGQAMTTELALTKDMYFVQLSDKTLANLGEMGYAPVVMEAGSWNGQDTAINSMGSQQNILVNANMDDETAYALTKAICENKDEMASAVASLQWFDPSVAGLKEYTGVPLHPGSMKYYEEMGYTYDK